MRIVFFGALVLTACSSARTVTPPDADFSFKSVKTMVLNISSEREAFAKLGQPSKKDSSNNKEKWIYNDLQTNYQRLTLTFDEKGLLESVLWFPLPGEQETQLTNIKAQIPGLKRIKTEEKSIDNLDTTSTYSNDSSVTLINDDANQSVEAIAWFVPNGKNIPPQAK